MSEKQSPYYDVWQLLSQVYGPYAFGVISLLVVWYFIVAPQLESKTVNFERNQQIVETMQAISQSLQSVSATTERTASRLEATAITMERTVEKLEDINNK